MLKLRLEAPFATFRYFTAGFLRPTAPFITPTAAYGLCLNLAGLESRQVAGDKPMTLMKPDLPVLKLCIGRPEFAPLPEETVLFQQLHNYPVGASGKEHAPACKGNKYNIAPARRVVLSNVSCLIGLETHPEVEAAIGEAILNGHRATPYETALTRYGVPFLGDNNFMVDRLEVVAPHADQPSARWLVSVDQTMDYYREPAFRMPLWIDREDMSQTVMQLFEWSNPVVEPPQSAWVMVGPPSVVKTMATA